MENSDVNDRLVWDECNDANLSKRRQGIPESYSSGFSAFNFSNAAMELTNNAVCATSVLSNFSFGPYND